MRRGTYGNETQESGAEAALSGVCAYPVGDQRQGWACNRGSCSHERRHDVSMVKVLGGRILGVEPRSKVSMMIMRPPQHGHGSACIGGSSALGSASVGSRWVGETPSELGVRYVLEGV